MIEFDDPEFVLALRDYIKEIVRAELEFSRPKYRYAEVMSVSSSPKTAVVKYPDLSQVSVRYGSIIPAVGKIVRVDGLPTDRYIADML